MRQAESSLRDSRQFRIDWDASPFSKYPDIHDDVGDLPDVEELNELGSLFESIYDSILFCIESYTERLAAALCLRRVSSAWSCALLKRMASLKGRVDRLASEKRTLAGIKRTAHDIYMTHYSDEYYDDFANY